MEEQNLALDAHASGQSINHGGLGVPLTVGRLQNLGLGSPRFQDPGMARRANWWLQLGDYPYPEILQKLPNKSVAPTSQGFCSLSSSPCMPGGS